MDPLTSQEKYCQFIVDVRYYCNMWARRSQMVSTLNNIISSKVKFKRTKTKQNAFSEIKRIVYWDTLLTYPDFNEEFKINTKAIDFQLGAIISHEGKQIALYIGILTNYQNRYTVIEMEIFSIIENLKDLELY